MPKVTYQQTTYHCRPDETVLQAFLRQGVELPFSCQKGSCHVCLMRCDQGDVSNEAQHGLRASYVASGFFLPCQCRPHNDLAISAIDHADLYKTAVVQQKELLTPDICRLMLEVEQPDAFHGGQFVNLSRVSDGLARSYSIADHPADDYFLELHIKRMANGRFSNWVFDDLNEMDEIDIQGPLGDCCYDSSDPNRSLLLIGGGTGLAPMLGIAREAIAMGHTGAIHLYHEALNPQELYLDGTLKELAAAHDNLTYFPCIGGTSAAHGTPVDSAIQTIRSNYDDLAGWHVYLAGPAPFVTALHQEAIAIGVPQAQIFTDPFDYADRRRDSRITPAAAMPEVVTSVEVPYPAPDTEIWEALASGKRLTPILNDFYTIVYDDPRLSPFFSKVTKQRSIEKQYLFLRQIFSGEKVYFGDRPRNAHHWMVISDELFDYREDLMESVLRKHDLPEHLIARWRQIEELYRPDIVKEKPWSRIMHGIEIPVDGFDELVLDSGTLCDSCGQPVEVGTLVRYHVRLGTIYCPDCTKLTEQDDTDA